MTDGLNVDYSQYTKWPALTAPTGQVYYKVPGTGFLYDPFLSQSKGRPVLFTNPQPELDARSKAEKQAKEAASPLNQALPLVGAVGGTVAAKYAVDALTPASAAEKLANAKAVAELAKVPVAQGGTLADAAPMARLSPSVLDTPLETAMNVPVNTPAAFTQGTNGSQALSAPEIISAEQVPGTPATSFLDGFAPSGPAPYTQGLTASNVLGGLAAAKGTYDTINGLQHGGKGLRPGLTTAGMGVGALLGGPIGAGIGGLAGNVIGYGLQGNGWKNDAALLGVTGGMAAPLVLAKHLGFNPIHQTTAQKEQERWGKLSKEGVANVDAAYTANHPQGDTGTWETGPMAGQKWTFEKAQELAKQDPTHFQHVYGNYSTFGNDWSTYSDEQQKAITGGLVNAGLYKGNKGDVIVTDKDAARKIKDQVLGINAPQAAQKPMGAPPSPESALGKQLAQRMNQKA